MQETEQLKSTYARELEELKKDHQLEIRKRTYLYELKKGEYAKYFLVLDKYTADFHLTSLAQLMAHSKILIAQVRDASQRNDTAGLNNASTTFAKEVNTIFINSGKEMAVLKQELNSIRFGASDTVIVKLDELDVVNKESLDFASLMMNRLLGFMLAGDSDSIKRDSATLTEIAVRVNQAVEDLRSAMRKDLSEI